MRLYAPLTNLGKGKLLLPHHHIKIKEEVRLNLQVWKIFLAHPTIFCRPFVDATEVEADVIQMFSDASGKIGLGAICEKSWTFGQWPEAFLKKYEPSIEYLELYALLVGILNWLHRFRNRRIRLYCDNMAVVHMVNNNSSKCKNCMILIRLLVLESLKQNTRVFAKYIKTKENGPSDALSRMQITRFKKLCPQMDAEPTSIPQEIWPIWKIWVE